ncbi:putative ISXo8 transposase [Kitasatospora sp. NE20-6]|uniref:IS701 family transposase n=1 Tax=Kitasatospora sp. NE20-6 TaxID=2859066 RepID=UPI0034DC304B
MNIPVCNERSTLDLFSPRQLPQPAGYGRVLREVVVQELSDALFASLPRRDQRQRGEQYLRGLLGTEGRKSIRNIAAGLGSPAAEQRIHHFISSSTWDWMPVRAALAAYVEAAVTPRAWVVRPMPIPKAGKHSVGVDHGFDPHRGREFYGQQAFGVWLAADTLSTPVNWRLLLPDSWAGDPARRDRVEIPGGVGGETPEECAAAVLEDILAWSPPARPVVLDICSAHAAASVQRFTRAGVPVIARLAANARFTVGSTVLPGYGMGPLTARRILESVKGLRRPTAWTDPRDPSVLRSGLAATVRVTPAKEPGGGPSTGEVVLLGRWRDAHRPPAELWLTNMTAASRGTLVQLTDLAGRVGHALGGTGAEAGLKDFEGRSFGGWHRHITLASAAHAVAVLAGSRRESSGHVTGRSAARLPAQDTGPCPPRAA